jgi:hypothetical protein
MVRCIHCLGPGQLLDLFPVETIQEILTPHPFVDDVSCESPHMPDMLLDKLNSVALLQRSAIESTLWLLLSHDDASEHSPPTCCS